MKNNFLRRALVLMISLIMSGLSIVGGDMAPYKILYNSDTTHILSCTSNWRKNREPLNIKMFQATVSEAADAGADVFLMAPGLGWVPWWPSDVLPLEKQAEWFRKKFDMPAAKSPFFDYILHGNDIIKISLEACKRRNMAFFISFRMNDQHGKDTFAVKPNANHILTIPPFYAENPQFLIGKQPRQPRWAQLVQNWAHPEVRAYKLKLIGELCSRYDIDGLELDFMRAPFYFMLDETTSVQRKEIMLSFINEVRRLLNATSKHAAPRWLCVRIPSYESAHDAMGIDVAAWADAGVEMFELSAFYDSEQTSDFASIRAKAPKAAFYPELTYSIAYNRNSKDRSHRRATKEYMDTTAHLAYSRGAAGVMLFNFQYYRDNRNRNDKSILNAPFAEPPFEWIKTLGHSESLATRPQYYFNGSILAGDPRREFLYPAELREGQRKSFPMDMSPPSGGWKKSGRLRLQSESSLVGCEFEVRFNGTILMPSSDITEPYVTPYTQMQGAPSELQAWVVPTFVPVKGRNNIEVMLRKGQTPKIIAIDLAME